MSPALILTLALCAAPFDPAPPVDADAHDATPVTVATLREDIAALKKQVAALTKRFDNHAKRSAQKPSRSSKPCPCDKCPGMSCDCEAAPCPDRTCPSGTCPGKVPASTKPVAKHPPYAPGVFFVQGQIYELGADGRLYWPGEAPKQTFRVVPTE